jgi:ATP-dependent protease ClpP protease subunit
MPSILDFKKPSQPFSIKSKSATRAEITLYGAIGESFWEDSISAKSFSEELKKLDSSVNEITVRINSPGGDVFDGIAIYNRLKQHPAKIIVKIDGLAASIASVIALAGDEVSMGEGALYMVHLPWTMAFGNRNELDNTINRLLDVEEQLISIYAKKCKKSRSEIKGMLEKETWMDAAQAIDNGFVDSSTEETMPIAAAVLDKASWISKMPKNINTSDKAAKEEYRQVKKKIEDYLARK